MHRQRRETMLIELDLFEGVIELISQEACRIVRPADLEALSAALKQELSRPMISFMTLVKSD